MKKLFFLFAAIICIVFISCKKTRICECKNTSNTYDAGEIDATKSQAKKACKDLSTAQTECYLKK
jgi:hypothetical protein